MRSRSLLSSFNYAIEGVVHAIRTERNMRIHLGVAVLVLVASLVFHISRLEFIAVVFAIAIVLAAELFNTAIEAAIDVATESYDPKAKAAKDIAAGAVLTAAVAAVIIGYLVFIGPLSGTLAMILFSVRRAPADITIIALAVTLVIGLVIKAVTKEGTYVRGGWPSMHTAVAAGAATAISYVTASPGVTALALLLVILVGQSRIENGAHTIYQVIAGVVLGILVTTLLFQLFWF